MSLRVITAPSTEPVTVTEVKLHCRVDHTTEDDWFTDAIEEAREDAEHLVERALITQTLELVIDAFPASEIRLPRPPLISIVSVKYDDPNGVEQTMDAADYTTDTYSEPGWLFPVYGTAWPSTLDAPNAVRVRYIAGYGAAGDVPVKFKNWIKVRVGTLWENRTGLVDSRKVVPPYVDRMLDKYRIYG